MEHKLADFRLEVIGDWMILADYMEETGQTERAHVLRTWIDSGCTVQQLRNGCGTEEELVWITQDRRHFTPARMTLQHKVNAWNAFQSKYVIGRHTKRHFVLDVIYLMCMKDSRCKQCSKCGLLNIMGCLCDMLNYFYAPINDIETS